MTVVEMVQTVCRDCGKVLEVEKPSGRFEHLVSAVVCDRCYEEDRRRVEERRAVMERDSLEQRRARWLKAAGIPAGFMSAGWEGHRDGRAVEAAKGWALGDPKGLLLTGTVGVGKSTLAAAAALEMLRSRSVRWVSVPTLISQLQLGWKDDRREGAIDTIVNGKMPVVLDDLDKVKANESGASTLFQIIDGRVSEGTSLLVTTNLTLGGIAARYAVHGEAIVSRLAGFCEQYKMVGSDRRLER